MSALHRQWQHGEAAALAALDAARSSSGLQSAVAWHEAIRQPTPAMTEAAARLRTTCLLRRAELAGANITPTTEGLNND